jgi:hypothetical protein
MMKKNIIYLCAVTAISLFFTSCKKENAGSGLKSVFSYVADGYKANFTNYSENATSYFWDFGDGSGKTSDKKSPEHIFTRKGDFLVSLTAKNGADSSVFRDTVSIIGPNIKIDGDYSDWQYVEYSHINDPSFPGTLRAIKTFAGTEDIFFYLEGTAGMKMDIVDIYIDGDNTLTTGFNTYLYPAGAGADFLLEGSPAAGWGDVFSHSGPQTAFSWNPFATFQDVMHFSTISTSGSKKILEFSIKKSALGTIRNYINFAIVESDAGYSPIGNMPESQTPGSKFLSIQL